MPHQYASKPTIDEWKQKLGYTYDAEFGASIGVGRSTIAIWRTRKRYPKYIHMLLSMIVEEKNGKKHRTMVGR